MKIIVTLFSDYKCYVSELAMSLYPWQLPLSAHQSPKVSGNSRSRLDWTAGRGGDSYD